MTCRLVNRRCRKRALAFKMRRVTSVITSSCRSPKILFRADMYARTRSLYGKPRNVFPLILLPSPSLHPLAGTPLLPFYGHRSRTRLSRSHRALSVVSQTIYAFRAKRIRFSAPITIDFPFFGQTILEAVYKLAAVPTLNLGSHGSLFNIL
ncbi:uncharacterized protein LOC117782581 [Drosophila innubila]|uniref:uncharacterized protein LOC117782581 n=1 Tax=Drosophila innubila TaxID=198719 RepID=UPI00148E6C55|nr:uncharacterized protein LOC117782581 [Drosophila innubila]